MSDLEKALQQSHPNTSSSFQEDTLIVRLLALFRYRVDDALIALFPAFQQDDDVFDAIITDGFVKLNVIMSPHWNQAIRRGAVTAGQDFMIQKWFILTDPSPSSHHEQQCIPLLESWRVLQEQNVVLNERLENRELDALQVLPRLKHACASLFPPDGEYFPVVGGRKMYQAMYDHDTWERRDLRWLPKDIDADSSFALSETGSEAPLRLRDLIHTFTLNSPQKRTRLSLPPLVARITAKSALNFYGKRHDRRVPFPCQAYFILSDDSFQIKAVLWSRQVMKLFTSLQLNDLILVTHYRLRQVSSSSVKETDPLSQESTSFELALNEDTQIQRLLSSHFSHWNENYLLRYPVAPLKVLSKSECERLADGTIVDVVGRVLYVGHSHCLVRQKASSETPHYSIYRWIQLEDTKSSSPLWVRLFQAAHCQADEEQVPRLNQYLLVRRVRVCRVVDGEGAFITYVSTTFWSQCEFSDVLDEAPFVTYSSLLRPLPVRRYLMVGGVFDLPKQKLPLGKELKAFLNQLDILSLQQVSALLPALVLQERRRIHFFAQLKSISFQGFFEKWAKVTKQRVACEDHWDLLATEDHTSFQRLDTETKNLPIRLFPSRYRLNTGDYDIAGSDTLPIVLTVQHDDFSLPVCVVGNASDAGLENILGKASFFPWFYLSLLSLLPSECGWPALASVDVSRLAWAVTILRQGLERVGDRLLLFDVDLWCVESGCVVALLSGVHWLDENQ